MSVLSGEHNRGTAPIPPPRKKAGKNAGRKSPRRLRASPLKRGYYRRKIYRRRFFHFTTANAVIPPTTTTAATITSHTHHGGPSSFTGPVCADTSDSGCAGASVTPDGRLSFVEGGIVPGGVVVSGGSLTTGEVVVPVPSVVGAEESVVFPVGGCGALTVTVKVSVCPPYCTRMLCVPPCDGV